MVTTSTGLRLDGAGLTLVTDRWEPPGAPVGSVLLLHGGGQTRHSWQATGRRLAERGWTTYALDARGHGESDWAPDGDYSTAAHADDIAAVAAKLDDPPVLVGASMGGLAALAAQAADPDLARALVLVDITPTSEPAGIEHIHRFLRQGLDGFDTLDDVLAAVIAYNPNRQRPPRKEGLKKNLRERDGRWYWHWDPRLIEEDDYRVESEAMRAEAARDQARRITVPTLLIRGAQSDIVGDEGVEELLELIPGARHVDVSGAGHMVGGDDNDVFTGELLKFLVGLRPGSR